MIDIDSIKLSLLLHNILFRANHLNSNLSLRAFIATSNDVQIAMLSNNCNVAVHKSLMCVEKSGNVSDFDDIESAAKYISSQ